MQFDVLTLFPEMFDITKRSILGKAQEKDLININTINIRDFLEFNIGISSLISINLLIDFSLWLKLATTKFEFASIISDTSLSIFISKSTKTKS